MRPGFPDPRRRRCDLRAFSTREPGDEIGRITAAFTGLASSLHLALLHRCEARLHHTRQTRTPEYAKRTYFRPCPHLRHSRTSRFQRLVCSC